MEEPKLNAIQKKRLRRWAKSIDASDIKYLGEWKGYTVYLPVWTDRHPVLGVPNHFLVKGSELYWPRDWDERWEIANYFGEW